MLLHLEPLFILLSTFGIGMGLGKLINADKRNRRPYITLTTLSAIWYIIVVAYW